MGSSDQQRAVWQMVGARLRHLRVRRNLRQETAAEAIGGSVSKISRMECGLTPLRRGDLTSLLVLYGVTDPAVREVIISVAVGERSPAWWDDQDVPLEETVLWHHEQEADLIRTYDPLQLPELLQTEEYARAAQLARHYPAPACQATETAVKNVLRRQDARRATLWAVIDEPVLWRPIGGDLDMHLRQLDALIAATGSRDITLQILPADSPLQPCSAPFTIFRVPGPRQILTVRHHTIDTIDTVDLVAAERYGILWDQLISVTRARADTPHILARIRRTLGGHP